MFAIIDKRAPKDAIENLKQNFQVFEFISEQITYDAIAGHPDIFMFAKGSDLVIAPNSPIEFVQFLQNHDIHFLFGNKEVGDKLHNSTQYNCVTIGNKLIHKKGYTDPEVLKFFNAGDFINVPQAYTRCSCIAIKNCVLTSDAGIYNELKKLSYNVLLINPSEILLPPYKYGFWGGCCGVINDTLYIIGSLQFLKQGDEIRRFLQKHEINIIELYSGSLYDGGGIFFIG